MGIGIMIMDILIIKLTTVTAIPFSEFRLQPRKDSWINAGVVVKMGHPFLLKHVYQDKLDDHAMVGNVGASFNQFQEPKEKDGDVSKAYAEIGFSLVKELEDALL